MNKLEKPSKNIRILIAEAALLGAGIGGGLFTLGHASVTIYKAETQRAQTSSLSERAALGRNEALTLARDALVGSVSTLLLGAANNLRRSSQ